MSKLDNDSLVNQGLFLMATSLFEDAIRRIMRIILITFPEKLKIKSCILSKEQVCEIAKQGVKIVIDNELYALFRERVKEQLECFFHIVSNLSRIELSEEMQILICKCADITVIQ